MNKLEWISQQVETLVDGLGMGLDPEIKRAVIAFNYAEFTTSMSCEGHLHVWGTPYPWIEVDGLDSIPRMEQALAEFYSVRKKHAEALQIVVYSDRYRVQSSNDEPCRDKVPLYVRDADYLAKTQREMDEFADFLIERVQ